MLLIYPRHTARKSIGINIKQIIIKIKGRYKSFYLPLAISGFRQRVYLHSKLELTDLGLFPPPLHSKKNTHLKLMSAHLADKNRIDIGLHLKWLI